MFGPETTFSVVKMEETIFTAVKQFWLQKAFSGAKTVQKYRYQLLMYTI